MRFRAAALVGPSAAISAREGHGGFAACLLPITLAAILTTTSLEATGATRWWYRLPGLPEPSPVVDPGALSAIDLSKLEQLTVLRASTTERVDLGYQTDGLHCDVFTGRTVGRPTRVGGVKIPVVGGRQFRIGLTLKHPANVEAFYVDGRDDQDRLVCRWFWRIEPESPASAQRTVYVFHPGQPVGYFRPRPAEAPKAAVRALHVYARVARDEEAGFILHAIETDREPGE